MGEPDSNCAGSHRHIILALTAKSAKQPHYSPNRARGRGFPKCACGAFKFKGAKFVTTWMGVSLFSFQYSLSNYLQQWSCHPPPTAWQRQPPRPRGPETTAREVAASWFFVSLSSSTPVTQLRGALSPGNLFQAVAAAPVSLPGEEAKLLLLQIFLLLFPASDGYRVERHAFSSYLVVNGGGGGGGGTS